MLGTLLFGVVLVGGVCAVVVLANRNRELLRRVLFWAGLSIAVLTLASILWGPSTFDQYDSIKSVALGLVALTLLVASKVYPL